MTGTVAGLPITVVAVLPPLFWAGNFVLARALHADIPPLALSFWRWAVALAILLPFAAPALWRGRAVLRRSWPVLVPLAAFGITGYNTLAYLGLRETTATNGVLLAAVTPILIVALSFLLGQPLRARQALGIGLSLAGVLVIVSAGRPGLLAGLGLNRGDLWILAASLDWALYSVCLRWRPAGLEPLAFLAAINALGLIPLAGLYAWEFASGQGFEINGANLAAIGYVALFPSVLAYVLWNRAVADLGASRTGQYMHLMPAFGALLSVLLLGEAPGWYHAAGIGLIGLGIWLAEREGRGGRPGSTR